MSDDLNTQRFSNRGSDDTNGTKQSRTIMAQIMLVPLTDEEDNFETITTLEEVREQILSEASILPDYTTNLESNGTRNAGIILLLGTIAREVIAQKDLVIEAFKAGATAISLLAKHGQIKRIEMTLDGDSLVIDEPDKVTAHRLLDSWEAKHPGKSISVSPSSTIQITGTLSTSS